MKPATELNQIGIDKRPVTEASLIHDGAVAGCWARALPLAV
jgi:hypothetical protein